jgi:hypothetical protein
VKKKGIQQAQQRFCQAVVDGNPDQIEEARERMERVQKAWRMRQETAQTLRIALALNISL